MSLLSFKSKPQNIEALHQENETRLLQLSPLVQKISSNSTLHFLSKGMDYIIEYLFYIAGLAALSFMFIMESVFPFHILGEVVNKESIRQSIANSSDLDTFQLAVKGLVGIIGILLICFGFMKNSARKRKDLLQQAGKVLKTNETYFLKMKSKLEEELPQENDSTEHLTKLESKPFPESIDPEI